MTHHDLKLGRRVEQPNSPEEAELDPVPNPHPGELYVTGREIAIGDPQFDLRLGILERRLDVEGEGDLLHLAGLHVRDVEAIPVEQEAVTRHVAEFVALLDADAPRETSPPAATAPSAAR